MSNKPAKKSAAPRRVKVPEYRSFRLSKSLKRSQKKLPSAWAIFKNAWASLIDNPKLFGGLALAYGLLNFVFVRGQGGGIDVVSQKSDLASTIGATNASNSLAVFGTLLKGASANSQVVSMYQTIIVIIVSLAIIWALRQTRDKPSKKLSVKDAFYKGMYPLVPYLLVVFVVALELIPLSIAGNIYIQTVVQGLAVTGVEQVLWTIVMVLMATLSFYLLCSTIFATYIVTLPGMTPMKAMRSARGLVLHRRLNIMAKLLWLSVMLLLVFGLVIVPLIAFLPILAESIFFVASLFVLPLVHSYLYNLYRAML